MNISLNIDDEVAQKVHKIAADKNTTLTAMVHEYLTSVADANTVALDATAREEAVERFRESVRRLSRPMGPRNWTRDDLYDRFDHKYKR